MRGRLPVLLVLAAVVAACGSTAMDGGANASPTATPADPAEGARSEESTPTATTSARRARLTRIGTFDSPIHVTAPPSDRHRVFVVEQGGTVRVIHRGKRRSRPFIDLRSRVRSGGEQGLLGMAFAPDYARSGRFYVSYTDNAGTSRIVEHRRATHNRARPGLGRVVLSQRQPAGNHNGGTIAFGPDRMLYIGLGDGGGGGDPWGPRGNAQNLGTLLGKLLRINPRPGGGRPYSIPADNPFVGRAGARPEIYAYGLRNPWRFSFDRGTGDLTIGDVGQNAVEEINFTRRGRGAGANFGWRPFEGTRRFRPGESAPGHVKPILERFHSRGWCSITGGVVVRDARLAGSLRGRYLFGDLCRPRVVSGRLARPRMKAVRRTSLRVPNVVAFGEDARARVYAVSHRGPVYRVDPR
jgi:glucose/arabinose dehydrogenase